MQKRRRVKPGDLIKIPFKENMHTYARVLVDGSYAIYDYPTGNDVTDYRSIIQSPILFIARVNTAAIKDGNWTVIENFPLEEQLKNFHPVYFHPSPLNHEAVEFYKKNKESVEEAIRKDWTGNMNLNLAGIYNYIHIESRINDYYDGRRNTFTNREIDHFFKYADLRSV